MVQAQDSSDPTGVSGPGSVPRAGGPPSNLVRARNRKAESAVALRLAGATWAEIAEALGYPTPRQAMVATERALARQLADPSSREAMRKIAGARLERLLRSTWSKAIDPDHPEHLLAVSKAREIIDRHAKLYGLDAPTEFVVHTPTQTQLEEWVATVLAGGAAALTSADVIDVEEVDDDAVQAG